MNQKPSNATYEGAKIDAAFITHNSRNKMGDVFIDTGPNSSNNGSADSTPPLPTAAPLTNINRAFITVDSVNETGHVSIVNADSTAFANPSERVVSSTTTSTAVVPIRSPDKLRSVTPMDEPDYPADSIPMLVQVQSKFTHLGIDIDRSQPEWRGDASGDLQFSVQGRVFPALKQLLTQRSLIFAQLFQQNPTANRFILRDIDPETFEAFLAYAQHNQQDLIEKNATGLLLAAHRFSLVSLKNRCERILMQQNICYDNAIDLLILADKANAPNLKDKIRDFIVEQCPSMVDTDDFERVTKHKLQLAMEVAKAAKNAPQNVQ